MKVKEIKRLLDAELIYGGRFMEKHVYHGFAADLLSDVLLYVSNQSVLLTGLCNPQVLRTAEMLDIICIIIVRGKTPDDSLIDLAKNKDICILRTNHTLFTASGLLYSAGLRGGE